MLFVDDISVHIWYLEMLTDYPLESVLISAKCLVIRTIKENFTVSNVVTYKIVFFCWRYNKRAEPIIS